MATQATTKHAEAKAKQYAQACMILETAGRKALDESLPGSERYNWAKLYLSKVMPDLKAIEHSGDLDTKPTALEIRLVRPDARNEVLEAMQKPLAINVVPVGA